MVEARRARVLVVGSGDAAAQHAELAARAGAAVRVVSEAPGDGVRAAAERHERIAIERRAHTPEDVAWATLVFALDADDGVNARVADLAQAAGRLVTVGAESDRNSFWAPPTLRAGDVVIAVATGDVAPMARLVLSRIGDRVGPSYGEALTGLEALRNELLSRGQADRWMDAVESLLDDDAWQAIERGTFARRLAAWR
jgi:siroheme synthase-like protein